MNCFSVDRCHLIELAYIQQKVWALLGGNELLEVLEVVLGIGRECLEGLVAV